MARNLDLPDTEQFGAVWDRVTNNASAPPAAVLSDTALQDAETLRAIMDVEAISMREACCLARRCGGEFGRVCAEIARSCRDTIRSLNTQYYIITGQSYHPGSTISPSVSTSDALRRIAASEQRGGDMLTRLAETTSSPSLARVCLCQARNCRRRACAAERLIAQCLCT